MIILVTRRPKTFKSFQIDYDFYKLNIYFNVFIIAFLHSALKHNNKVDILESKNLNVSLEVLKFVLLLWM